MSRPRVLIQDWLPAAAIGVECIPEEDNPTAKPPTKYLHVWMGSSGFGSGLGARKWAHDSHGSALP